MTIIVRQKVIYTLFFSYLSLWSNYLVFYLGFYRVFGLSWSPSPILFLLEGIKTLILDVFIRMNSHVNHMAGERAILGIAGICRVHHQTRGCGTGPFKTGPKEGR